MFAFSKRLRVWFQYIKYDIYTSGNNVVNSGGMPLNEHSETLFGNTVYKPECITLDGCLLLLMC